MKFLYNKHLCQQNVKAVNILTEDICKSNTNEGSPFKVHGKVIQLKGKISHYPIKTEHST